ncbi:MAG: CBS domain-containing protein [Dethiobacter sp.]|nr:CBS domain-containing protein [Dethiobacter sp.]MBS3989049.1 CBS domain-containing protein [Dethiobacter sp.]
MPSRQMNDQTSPLELLKRINPFYLLDDLTLAQVAQNSDLEFYAKGSYVFRQGDLSRQILFIVASGTAEVTVLDEHDRETIAGVRHEGEFFGETVFLSDEPYPGSVRAMTDLTCLIIHHEIFETVLDRQAEFLAQFNRLLADRMRSLYKSLVTEPRDGTLAEELPMRKRVTYLMSKPPLTALPKEDIAELAERMATHNVSSLVVVDEDNRPLGLVTEKDLVGKVLARRDQPKKLTAADIMNSNIFTVEPTSFYFEALLSMVRNKVKHLVVASGGRLEGIVTIRDLITSRSMGDLSIVNSIEAQNNIEGLAKASGEIDRVLRALVLEKAVSKDILQIITELFDRLTSKVIQTCEQEMIKEGYGPPPVSYSWITMGSSGRQEQFIKTDQDNGIIYDNVSDDKKEQVAKYFLLLGEKVAEGLHRCGFAKCEGNVMASNPQWCRSFNDWREAINEWVEVLNPENIRMMTIFLDFRHLCGKKSLCDLLRNFVIRKFQKSATALHFLVMDDLEYRVPLGFFKQIVTEKSKEHRNMVNLKTAAYVHLIDCLRAFSLREGIVETNTLKRLELLAKKKLISADDAEALTTAYETLMMFRIRQSLLQIDKGLKPDNYITPEDLNKKEKAALREAFLAVERLQILTGQSFYFLET